MALYEYALQASRRGYVKKIKETFLETCITNANIGSGVVLRPDKTCGLAFCAQDDRLALVTQEGYLLCMPVNLLPYTIEEVLRLNVSDHLVSAFAIGQKSSFIAITQHGKAFHREMSWLEPSASFKTQGQSILSKARRQAGVRLVAAAAVDENDWGVVLASDGSLTTHKLGDIFGKGAVLDSSSGLEVLGFAAFSLA
jgi:DNA gyrase/topoisomerase IV subunit A